MAKNAARAAIPAPVITPAAAPSNVQPAASAANVTPAAGNGASQGAPIIATGPQAPVGPDPGTASQNRVESARSRLISEASRTIKIDSSKEFNRDRSPATSDLAPAKPVAAADAAGDGQAAKPAKGSIEEQLATAVAQVARLNKMVRDTKQAAKPAAPAAPPPEIAADAAAMAALRKAAKSDPYAVFQALEREGMPYQQLLETFVSQKPGEKPSAATTGEANAALDALKADFEAYKAGAEKEKTDAQKRADESERRAANVTLIEATKAIIASDGKRWELVAKEPEAVSKAIAAGQKAVLDLGRDVNDEEGQEILHAALDLLEEHYAELGQRYSKAPPAPPPRRFAATISRDMSGSRPQENGQTKRLSVDDARRAAVESAKGIRVTLT